MKNSVGKLQLKYGYGDRTNLEKNIAKWYVCHVTVCCVRARSVLNSKMVFVQVKSNNMLVVDSERYGVACKKAFSFEVSKVVLFCETRIQMGNFLQAAVLF